MVHRFGQSSRDFNALPLNWKMTCLNCLDEFLMVRALVCTVYTLDKTYSESWHKTIDYHDSPNHCTTWTLSIKRILSLCQDQSEASTYEWNFNVIIYLYEFGHCWWRLMTIDILNRNIMISHGIETICALSDLKDMWSRRL